MLKMKILELIMQNSIYPTFRRIPSFIIRSNIVRNYELIKLKIIGELINFNDVISIIFNLWIAANQDIGYLCTIVHFINFD